MSLKKNIRTYCPDELIRLERTGHPSQLTNHLKISGRPVLNYIEDLKASGCHSDYRNRKNSYIYSNFKKVISFGLCAI